MSAAGCHCFDLMKRLQKLAETKLSKTTPYHPQGNGQAERWNRIILPMLRTLTESQKANWKDHVDKVVFAYNCTGNDATGYSPFYLLYGRSPRLPIDIMFGIDPDHEVTSRLCVEVRKGECSKPLSWHLNMLRNVQHTISKFMIVVFMAVFIYIICENVVVQENIDRIGRKKYMK